MLQSGNQKPGNIEIPEWLFCCRSRVVSVYSFGLNAVPPGQVRGRPLQYPVAKSLVAGRNVLWLEVPTKQQEAHLAGRCTQCFFGIQQYVGESEILFTLFMIGQGAVKSLLLTRTQDTHSGMG